jgi:putative transposase
MYDWRKLTPQQREDALTERKRRHSPWHSPPHWDYEGELTFLVSATCFEHVPVIGKDPSRMVECEQTLLSVCQDCEANVYAWCLLPNHYHLLLRTDRIKELRKQLGLFHGRSSFNWNSEDNKRGRQVWHNCFDRPMKSERHFWVTLNYVHHNAVHHGYVERWQDWPYSSAAKFLDTVGRDKAMEIWNAYPILDYGKKWDV